MILREVLEAQTLLADDFGVAADVWSVPSFTELARDGQEVERWNLFHPGEDAKHVLGRAPARGSDRPGGRVDGLHARVRGSDPPVRRRPPYRVLGTDGFGRSDYRKTLRSFFEVDRHHVVLAALTELAKTGKIDADAPKKAIESYDIDPERPAPWKV